MLLVEVSSEYPGRCFVQFQQFGQKISGAGILVFFKAMVNVLSDLDSQCFMVAQKFFYHFLASGKPRGSSGTKIS